MFTFTITIQHYCNGLIDWFNFINMFSFRAHVMSGIWIYLVEGLFSRSGSPPIPSGSLEARWPFLQKGLWTSTCGWSLQIQQKCYCCWMNCCQTGPVCQRGLKMTQLHWIYINNLNVPGSIRAGITYFQIFYICQDTVHTVIKFYWCSTFPVYINYLNLFSKPSSG